MKKIYSFAIPALLMLATGCSKDAPFDIFDNGEGGIRREALGVDLRADEKITTRADEGVSLNDFRLTFTREGDEAPMVSYLYSEMPEVVTLKTGSYIVTASYGENAEAAFESPYYMGRSESIVVRENEINDEVAPIICRLENIKVTVEFDNALIQAMSPDSYVDVQVGDNSNLRFTQQHHQNGTAGYYAHAEGISLVSTFHGTVEGLETVQVKSVDKVSKGNHYKIRYTLRSNNGSSAGGDITGQVSVDASVSVIDVERNVETPEDELLDDSERPKEDDPGKDPGVDPGVGEKCTHIDDTVFAVGEHDNDELPVIEGLDGYTLDKVVEIADGLVCGALVHSCKGISEFKVNIISPTLTPEELGGMGLASEMDLVNPGEYAEPLEGLGFPTYVGGSYNQKVDITGFLGMLAILGPGVHEFRLTITDENGSTVRSIILEQK